MIKFNKRKKGDVVVSENSPNNEVRRYVGRKETIAYVLNDFASSLNIDDYKERYI